MKHKQFIIIAILLLSILPACRQSVCLLPYSNLESGFCIPSSNLITDVCFSSDINQQWQQWHCMSVVGSNLDLVLVRNDAQNSTFTVHLRGNLMSCPKQRISDYRLWTVNRAWQEKLVTNMLHLHDPCGQHLHMKMVLPAFYFPCIEIQKTFNLICKWIVAS